MNTKPAVLATACAAATVLLLSGCASSATVDEAEAQHRSFSPASDVLTIAVDRGDLEVVPAEVDDIQVTRWVSGGAVVGPPRATWELDGETLSLQLHCGPRAGCDARYEVAVPEGTSLTVEGGNGDTTATGFAEPLEIGTDNGRVTVENVSGPLVLRSGNGGLHARGIVSPTLEAHTENGTIDVSFARAPDDVRVSTANGSATVELPEAGYDVSSSSDNGEVVTDVEVAPGSGHVISAETENGDIRLVPAR
ncbi:DUF4097 family beta strand repeat-containing protein [Nocardiopsis sp. NPDC101807]|uniref:DUF4097 family beta strand repeat-containing protein n=1 Tax=Nocardiopsis sp. NPDC101807 TaxID=3364339 RepID=UPI00381D9C60